jgi:hypothetical protein
MRRGHSSRRMVIFAVIGVIAVGNVGNASQGDAVAISADGNTAIIGGYLDNGGVDAVSVNSPVISYRVSKTERPPSEAL